MRHAPPRPAVAAETITRLPDLLAVFSAGERTAVDGFGQAVAALKAGHGAAIDGAWGSSAALAVAALARESLSTVVVALAHPGDVERWAADLHSLLGEEPAVFDAADNLPSPDRPSDEAAGARLRLLRKLESATPPRVVLATIHALLQPVPDRTELRARVRALAAGQALDPDELAGWLVDRGYRRTEAVEVPGEFSRRGGLLDVYPPDADAPVRLEFFGDELESIRAFSADTQRSLGPRSGFDLLPANFDRPGQIPDPPPPRRGKRPANGVPNVAPPVLSPAAPGSPPRGHLCDYLPIGSWTVLLEPEELDDQGKHYLNRLTDPVGLFSVQGVYQQLVRFPSVRLTALPGASVEATCHLRAESVERFSGNINRLREELRTAATSDLIVISCTTEAECKRLGDVLTLNSPEPAGADAKGTDAKPLHPIQLVLGHVRAGYRLILGEGRGIVVLGSQELFHREDVRKPSPRRKLESRAIDSFLDLAEDDLVVHLSHGIARFRGMQVIEKNGQAEEHLILEFREGTRVFVPASKIDLVQKYVGGGTVEPELSKLGGTSWQRRKEKVEAAVLDLASEMIQLQALRESQPGSAFPPDTEWQAEFEALFPYQETPDQLTSLAEIKQDMERARPMDRLVCGDVGYGKTELAIRAAFKAIDNGKQVAVLVPTTVLAEQHYRTFSSRLAEYPFTVEVLSRFRGSGEQRRIVERVGNGGVDVVIGTHRLVSNDVRFKDLGLVIIDEEQRFGVEHKERLKSLRATVDVLTLTATPIPRTLHQSLLGIREISNLETAPVDRLPIETRISRFDPTLIRHAVLRELNRDGQVYFVHNRVHNIQAVADELQRIVPEATYVIGHGQMPGDQLEAAMLRFVRREADILVATTIIESGLDIPNANTIFINQADNYGLADLHQLRGRVGRYKHRAYAYLLVESGKSLTQTAARRLKAIEEFTDLGAGFRIALRDLEIRGAGNILGTQQSGHIAAVGYELYCSLLENAVRTLKSQPPKTPLEVNLDLPIEAYLPREYVPGQRLKIEVYRRLARVRRADRLADFRQELQDRFGPLPVPAEWMLWLQEIRILCARWQVHSVHLEKTDLVLGYRSVRLMNRLVQRSGGRLVIADPASAYYRLPPLGLTPAELYASLKDVLRFPEQPV